MVVLAILGTLGVAALDVADINILVSANDRDAKTAFFHAESGANVGLRKLCNEESFGALESGAIHWKNQVEFNCPLYDLFSPLYGPGNCGIGTYGRAGHVDVRHLRGTSTDNVMNTYLIRADRQGERNSHDIMDIWWREIDGNSN